MKRYVTTIDLYTFADTDEQAIQLSDRLAKLLRNQEDNHASVVRVHQQDFGSFRPIEAQIYEDYLNKRKEKESIKKELEDNKRKQDKVGQERLNYIKSFNFGFSGLEVDDSGGLLLNGRPVKDQYFSKGELEIIVAKLYASLNPDLKVRFIDDFDLLDDDNQIKILDELLKDGFQIITAEVGTKVVKDNTILLRECALVKSYEDSKKSLL